LVVCLHRRSLRAAGSQERYSRRPALVRAHSAGNRRWIRCLGSRDVSRSFALKKRRDFVFRPAKTGEMPSIRALLRLYPQQLAQQNLPGISSFLVAIAGDRIIGCCALQVYSKRLAEVRSLAVHSSFQKRGVASRLVELCKQRARTKGVKELFAVTSQTSFFERAGFATFRRERTAMFFEVG